ncbi:MAG: TIGR02530 family flagellar biosynthesis protein [Chitinophagales bacterium]
MTNKVFNPSTTQPIQPISPQTSTTGAKKTGASAFDKILSENISGIKFSGHAQQRLKSRNIEIGTSEMQKLQDAVTKAREKGARDSLILMDNLALVVSVKNNTVVTAIDGENIKENIFTNIDSAVVL